jgi:hypothetical protein
LVGVNERAIDGADVRVDLLALAVVVDHRQVFEAVLDQVKSALVVDVWRIGGDGSALEEGVHGVEKIRAVEEL